MSIGASFTQPGKQNLDHTEIVRKIRKLLAQGMTRVQIGQRLGVHAETVARWLKECP